MFVIKSDREALIVSLQLVIQFLYSRTVDQPRDQVAILEVSVFAGWHMCANDFIIHRPYAKLVDILYPFLCIHIILLASFKVKHSFGFELKIHEVN